MYLSLSSGHLNSKVDFVCILPLSLGMPNITNITIAVEWPLTQFNQSFINTFFCYSCSADDAVKNLICLKCGKGFATNADLTRHIKREDKINVIIYM